MSCDGSSIESLDEACTHNRKGQTSGANRTSDTHQEHLRLAEVVKGVHADLRKKYKQNSSNLERIWYEHCQNKPVLSQYAVAMQHLATDHWAKKQETRIDWCRDVIQEYFHAGGLLRVREKEARRKLHEPNTPATAQTMTPGSSNKQQSEPISESKNVRQTLVNVSRTDSEPQTGDVLDESKLTKESLVHDVKNCSEAATTDTSHVKHESEIVAEPLAGDVTKSARLDYHTQNVVSQTEFISGIHTVCANGNLETGICRDRKNEQKLEENKFAKEDAETWPVLSENGILNGNEDSKKSGKYNTVQLPLEGRVRLLDVGSCFNPFLSFPEILAVGIDISPATQSVFHCDFLHLRTTDHLQVAHDTMETFINHLSDPVEWLPKECFHVVVFSLLLEYFPAPYQRWLSCEKAQELLMYDGILIIITPDSHAVNRNAPMMKSWKIAIEAMGFKRWRYVKQEHLHCMVFRKVEVNEREKQERFINGITADMLYIPQDFNSFDDRDGYGKMIEYTEEDEEFYRLHTLNELPVNELSDSENEFEGT